MNVELCTRGSAIGVSLVWLAQKVLVVIASLAELRKVKVWLVDKYFLF